MTTAYRLLTEPEKVQFQQAILPVVASGVDGSWRPMGTCWVFATYGRDALAFSAAHVFDQIVRDEGRHDSGSRMSPIFRNPRPPAVSLSATYMKAICRHDEYRASAVDITKVWRDGLSDVAVCHLTFQEPEPPESVFAKRLAVHMGPVDLATPIAAVGYGGMGQSQYQVDEVTGVSTGHHYHHLKFQHGKTTGCHLHRGPRGPDGPCFEMDVATEHGMSGGPILHKQYGDTIVACGVISRGTSFGGDETTMASCLWPAYSFDIDILVDGADAQMTMLDLAKVGIIDEKANGPAHFETAGRRRRWSH